MKLGVHEEITGKIKRNRKNRDSIEVCQNPN
jgi:hypothetical protein